MALTGEADVSTDPSPIPVHEPGRTSTDGDEPEPGEGDHCEAVDADPRLPEVPEPDTETDACGRPTSRFRRAARVVLPLLIGVSAVIVVAGLAGDAGSMIHALESVDPVMVAVALLCEMASFAFLGLHLRLLGGPPANVRRLAPFRLALVVFGLGAVMPAAPAEGLVMAGRALRHRRLARRRTLLVLGVSQFFGTAGLYVLAAIDAVAVVALSDDRPLSARWLLLGGAVGAFVVVGVLAGILTRRRFAESVGQLAGRIRHPRLPAPRDERRARGLAWHDAAMHVVQERHNTAKLAVSILLGWALDGGCLFFALRASVCTSTSTCFSSPIRWAPPPP
jgi:uncharacterized membrane protein YbhN (UPF0104 family)